ncbi:MAG: hypothetical protein HQL67_04680 [Magnetococcales bacterium]|nr:hypothetical protein [Magnetococcales bacterium]
MSNIGMLLRLLVMLTVIFATPIMLGDRQAKPAFDATQKNNLTKLNPDYVFVGSSVLLSRLDVDYFNQLLSGQSGYILGDFGAPSALWYLYLKNSLIASNIRPKTVFIFFRNTALTNPIEGASSLFIREKIDKNALEHEPIYDRVMGYHKTFIHSLGEWFVWLYPIQEHWQKSLKWQTDSIGFLFGLPGYAHYKWQTIFNPNLVSSEQRQEFVQARAQLSTQINQQIFTARNIRDQQDRIHQVESGQSLTDFKKRLPLSFLPEMVRLGKEAGLKLVLVRIQTRPHLDGTLGDDSPEFNRYRDDLAEYAAQQGVGFHDFSHDPNITRTMYKDGSHIAEPFRKHWTKNMVDRLQEYLR